VLEEAYDHVDCVSLHAYYEPIGGDVAGFLASAVDMDHMIDSVAATADAVQAKLRSRRRIQLSFDEWNVWYQSRFPGEAALEYVERRPLIEDDYSALDAVVVGSLLACLLRHSDRVAVACQAQLVNVIAPIRTEPDGPAWKQAIFDPFALTARYATGEVLHPAITSPRHHTARFGDVATLDAVATLDDDAGTCTIILVNRSRDEPVAATITLPSGSWRPDVHHHLDAASTTAVNTSGQPDAVRAGTATPPDPQESQLTLVVPPASWHLLRFLDRPA
jgi:alpha-L-arabinofuranosidase